MKTQQAYLSDALAQVQARRRTNLAVYRAERAAAEDAEPRLIEIEREMTALGAELARTALAGKPEALAALRERLQTLSNEKQALLAARHLAEPKADCELCGDTGYRRGALCDCVKSLARRQMYADLSKECPIGDCTFDNFDLSYYPDVTDEHGQNPRRRMTQILALCREYAETFAPGASANLLFIGKTGLGKTHLSLSIAARVLERGFGVVYGAAQNLLSPVSQEYFRFSGEDDRMRALLECDLLIIDDLGTELHSSFTNAVIYNLLNTRLLQKRPTILNTNLSLPELEARYEPRVSSRLIGEYTLKRFLGADIRQRKALERGVNN